VLREQGSEISGRGQFVLMSAKESNITVFHLFGTMGKYAILKGAFHMLAILIDTCL
jgi:hypothetical protein